MAKSGGTGLTASTNPQGGGLGRKPVPPDELERRRRWGREWGDVARETAARTKREQANEREAG